MDLKRAWRNGFLVSLIFALPLPDLYYFQHENSNVNGSSRTKPVQQTKNCVPDNDCAGSENSGSGQWTVNNDIERNGLSISGTSSSSLLLVSNNGGSGSIREAALHFSPEDILQSVDLNGEENPAIDADISSIAARSFGFGASTSYNPPWYNGPFAHAAFIGSGGTGSAIGSQNAFNDVNETAPSDPFAESSTQTEATIHDDTPTVDRGTGIDSDILQTVPEPSSLVLLAIGTISAASLFYQRKLKPTAIQS